MRQDTVVSGSVSIQIEGVRDNRPEQLHACRRLGGATRADGQLPFQFRYFQNLEQDVVLPEGFEPRAVNVEVRSARARTCARILSVAGSGRELDGPAPSVDPDNPMFKRSKPKPQRIDTLIGAGTRIIGDVQFTGGFHVDGHVKGNVDAPAGLGRDAQCQRQRRRRGLGRRAERRFSTAR